MPDCPLLRKRPSSPILAVQVAEGRDPDMPLAVSHCRRTQARARGLSPHIFLPGHDFSFRLFSAIDEAAAFWSVPGLANDAFLGEDYLRALEQAPPPGLTPYYMVFFKKDQPAGLAYLQLIDFRTDESLQEPDAAAWASRLWQVVRKKAQSLLRFRLLHLGNALLTGPRGYAFHPGLVKDEAIHPLLSAALPLARREIGRRFDQSATVYLVKDVPLREPGARIWKSGRYREVCFLPNMVLYLNPGWQDFDDYLASLQSKYRVRARRAFRLLDGVESRELSLREIRQYGPDLYRLYLEIARSVDFNMADLHPQYFENLKREMGGAFRLVGYFLEGRLLGFYTTIENGIELEAHYIGFDQAANRSHQLYLNMLFDMIRDGIGRGVEYISFARTAMEIKSSVGAVAEQYHCYIRARSPLVNLIVRPLIRLLEPRQEWEPRHPFK